MLLSAGHVKEAIHIWKVGGIMEYQEIHLQTANVYIEMAKYFVLVCIGSYKSSTDGIWLYTVCAHWMHLLQSSPVPALDLHIVVSFAPG